MTRFRLPDAHDRSASAKRDRGATLAMILVLIVIASLMLLPTMDFAVTTLRANRALGRQTAATEAAKGGLRVALADPRQLYDACASVSPIELPTAQLSVATTTRCSLVGEVTRYDTQELPWDLAVVWRGADIPDPAAVTGQAFIAPTGTDETWWVADVTADRIAPSPLGPNERSIWLPDLTERASSVRSPDGFAMPPGEINPGYTSCTVYFPGTYDSAVAIDGPTYFTSGVYTFLAPLQISAGASVVMGSGQHGGCTDDQRAAFSAIGVPTTHEISGVGATLIFGDEGRLAIGGAAPSAGEIEFKMNTRYVAAADTAQAPSVEVSIMTVNGIVDPVAGLVDLQLPGALTVPAAVLGDHISPATDGGYVPSVLVPVPDFPSPPTDVTVATFPQALTVTWEAPAVEATAPVVDYRVTATPTVGGDAHTCVAPRYRRACTIVGLTDGVDYDVAVVARTAGAESVAATSLVAPDAAAAGLTTPGEATPWSAVVYDDAVVVSWQPPADDGGAPIVGYTAQVAPLEGTDEFGNPTTLWPGGNCRDDGEFTQCSVPLAGGLADTIGGSDLLVTVSADNVPTQADVATGAGTGATMSPDTVLTANRQPGTYVPPSNPIPTSPDQTAAVIDISVPSGAPIEVDIGGYVAVPQGRIAIAGSAGAPASIRVDGGVLAAWLDLDPTCGPTCVIGQTNEPTQRTVRIVTDTVAAPGVIAMRSDAIVQINANGAWMVNSWEVQTARS